MNLGTRKGNISKGALAGIILGAIACAAVISVIIITLLISRRRLRYHEKLSRRHLSSKASTKIEGVQGFTFKNMARATNNFNFLAQVGQGGYGKVYKGFLADNKVVAIKRAEEASLQGQKEFLTEIKLLSRLHHRNLVSLVGYCDEESEQMLVYEFMPNGTLRDWLSAKATEELNFKMRLKIALDSAKGILYLHTEAQPPVFHRDIKASNILLDSKLTAKVADFGLSRLVYALDDEGNMPSHVSTAVRGTPGYLDPEYCLTRKFTDKSDVYSIGIVFLELLTGMRPISHGKNIVREVNMAHKSGMMFSIIDSRMGSHPAECVERFMGLALGCCNDRPEKRPSMQDVVRELENILGMLPAETNDMLTETYSSSGGKSKSTSTSTYTSTSLFYAGSSSNDAHGSSSSYSTSLQGSELSSGVIPTITPR
uniref:non-specific serine/threonine protein kinase n=2 Tax=Rhizophora mucronata TaxID=61149 RepID=A0A2P2IWQ5_RHIMU